MKTQDVHVNAVRLGDFIPAMGGEIVDTHATRTRRYFHIVTPDGRRETRWRRLNTKVPVAARRRRA